MFDGIKRAANATKFKADQMLRVQGVQGEIGNLNHQVADMHERIAMTVLGLHQQRGTLGIPELDEVCAYVDGLMAQVAQKEAQIQAIWAEQVPQAPPPQPGYPQGAQPGYAPPQQPPYPQYAQPPAQPGFTAPPPPTQPEAQQPAYTPSAAPAAPAATKSCPNCGTIVPAQTRFCTNCGNATP